MNYTHDYTDYIYEVSRKTCDQDNTLFELNVELYGEQSELDPSAHESLESIPLFSGIELFNKVTDKYSVKIIESESRLSFLRSCITDYLRLLELNGENAPIMIVLAFEVYDSKEKHVGFMVQGLSHTKFYYIEGGKEL